MPVDKYLRAVTSLKWREQLALVLLGKTEKDMPDGWADWAFNGSPYKLAEALADRGRPVPAPVMRAILDDHKPKAGGRHRGGRHSRREVWAMEKARSIAAYVAMTQIMEKNPELTAPQASKKVAAMMNRSIAPGDPRSLSSRAVCEAWRKFEKGAPVFSDAELQEMQGLTARLEALLNIPPKL